MHPLFHQQQRALVPVPAWVCYFSFALQPHQTAASHSRDISPYLCLQSFLLTASCKASALLRLKISLSFPKQRGQLEVEMRG